MPRFSAKQAFAIEEILWVSRCEQQEMVKSELKFCGKIFPAALSVVLDSGSKCGLGGRKMATHWFLAFSLRQWWNDASAELTRYFHTMDTTQWLIISACGVVFGFLCLRGTSP